MKTLKLFRGEINLPAFFPDGTYGSVRAVDSSDLESCGVQGVVMNTFHLLRHPGIKSLKAMGGLNSFCGWKRPILTDSGGFQAFSLIRENPDFGEIRNNEIIFRNPSKSGGKKDDKLILSPQKCIQTQYACGSDIIMSLDYCTHPDDPKEINERAVEITVRWAKECKKEYEILTRNKKQSEKPLLFAIIQGGSSLELRRQCAEALVEIGFDGYGYGGWPVDSGGTFTYDLLKYTSGLIPDNAVKYAMGIGKPDEIRACAEMGYDLFDCVIPTREARHKRIYVSGADVYEYLYIMDEKYARDVKPLSDKCDCHCCKNYSRAYLRHLFSNSDPLALRLATIHNLRFYTSLTENLWTSIEK